MLPRDLTLHVGLQKTGTSLVQRSMRRLRDRLGAAGFVYLDRREMMKLPAYHGWRAFPLRDELEPFFGPRLRPMRVHMPDLVDAFSDQIRDLAAARTRGVAQRYGGTPPHLFISNETLAGRMAPDVGSVYRPRAEAALEHLISALSPERTSIVLYVRRQDTLIESQYMERIHSGEVTEFADWARVMAAGPFIKFADLMTRLAAVGTVVRVIVKPFETIRAGGDRFVADLLAGIGARVNLDGLDFAEENPSYSAPALAAALALNPSIRNRKQLLATRDFLRATYPLADYPRPELFSAAQRAEVLEMYADSNRAFFTQYLPAADPDSYRNDAATDRLRDLP